ncbi:hypothetical protein [Nostoc sp.]|uniref:hypothetical protein n=1 Tax=Nostoc sp. TaxID=1180 RepID=UPI002FFD06EC
MGIIHGAWGIGHWAWGMGHGALVILSPPVSPTHNYELRITNYELFCSLKSS